MELQRRETVAAVAQVKATSDEETMKADLGAVAALPAAKRKKLEAECRVALPATVSEGFCSPGAAGHESALRPAARPSPTTTPR